MNKIQHLSRWMVLILTLAITALLLLAVYLIFSPEQAIIQLYKSGFSLPETPALSFWQTSGLKCLALLNLLPALYVMWNFRKLFRRFMVGEIFTIATTMHIYNAAKGFIAWAIIAMLNTTIAGLILTANAAAGGRMLIVEISSTELIGLFAGAILLVMSWVMQEAAHLSDENAGFV